ncbi:uncharacterized protein LOC128894846 [Hylaeus anthracinus]|uniref:uncharacterized protein LOC128894846 n=1 Tax=Hylaeus anthracinus TaxID=313031 RepID=UPI0023B9F8D0|nr:uncharacterized protein LOC128894846 [Hylaeus anthracinus]
MFMFPEPPPIDYYVTDVSQSYLTDGIFHHGKPSPTHKYVAKQLKPIKRTLSDPVAPIQELDSRTLNRWIEKEKGGYVAPCGQDDGLIYQTLSMMPQWKRDRRNPVLSIFPRSPQYELDYIRKMRLKDFQKRRVIAVECPRKEETTKKEDEECGLLKPPFWWKDKTAKPRGSPVGNIDDYKFEKLRESSEQEGKISERLRLNHPRKYIPGAIHRMKNPEDTSMKDTLDRADAFEVVLRTEEKATTDTGPSVDECVCPVGKRPRPPSVRRDLKRDQCAGDDDKSRFDKDRRWQPICDEIGFSGTDLERQEELRKLTKPFLHELHAWYTKNKPTRLA